MPILVFQHHPLETPGRIGESLRDLGHKLRVVKLHAGQPLPPDLDDVDGIISMGGPMNVDETAQNSWIEGECALIKQAHEKALPVLGVCLGAQLIAKALGGEVGPMDKAEIGLGPIRAGFPGTIDPLHAGIPWTFDVMHIHGQEVKKLPNQGVPMYGSALCKTQSFKVGLRTYGFQFHFEWRKEDIRKVIDANRQWITTSGYDPAALLSDVEAKYDMHRLFSDKLCNNIANLLFPIDKRLPSDGRPVENFRSIG